VLPKVIQQVKASDDKAMLCRGEAAGLASERARFGRIEENLGSKLPCEAPWGNVVMQVQVCAIISMQIYALSAVAIEPWPGGLD
jgi:hypothetical protein